MSLISPLFRILIDYIILILFLHQNHFGEYWQLIVTLRYLNFMCEDDEMKEDKSYYYKIEGERYTQVENFDEDDYDEGYDEDEEF